MCPSVQKEGAGFSSIGENLIHFEERECFSFSLEMLDEMGKGIEETIKRNNTCIHNQYKWHIARLGYSGLKRGGMLSAWKLNKIVRGLQEQNTFTESKSLCFFYGEDISSEQLHEARTRFVHK